MQYVEVAGVRVSKIGLGCWQFGSRGGGYGRDYAHDEAIRITNKALDLGINLIDTAEIYGFGQSERIVGRAITGRRATKRSWRPRSGRCCRSLRSLSTGAGAGAPPEGRHHRSLPGPPGQSVRSRWHDDERDAPAASATV